MTLAITTADFADANDVIDLIHRVFDEYGFTWEPEEEFWDLLADESSFPYQPPRGQLWVMRDEQGRVVGSVAAEILNRQTVELHRLYLDAARRGAGLGRRLLLTAEGWARDRGCQQAILWSDTNFLDAHRLYERIGYVQTGQRSLEDVNQTIEYRYERSLVDREIGTEIDHDE